VSLVTSTAALVSAVAAVGASDVATCEVSTTSLDVVFDSGGADCSVVSDVGFDVDVEACPVGEVGPVSVPLGCVVGIPDCAVDGADVESVLVASVDGEAGAQPSRSRLETKYQRPRGMTMMA